MGLAAVPFGTAQAENYEIKVTQEHKPDAEYFRISVGEKGKEPKVVEVVWPHKKALPEPIRDNPFGFVRVYTEELRREEEILMERGAFGELFRGDLEANVVEWMGSYFPRANFFGNEDKFLMKKRLSGI